MKNHGRDDSSFVEDLKKSKEAVIVAAKMLSAKGYPVIIRPTFIRPYAEQMSEYADDGDIEIIQRVEIKRRMTTDFTSASDFPYKTIIVDACHCYDNAKQKPYAYIIFNKTMSHAFVVNVRKTRHVWTRTTKRDRLKNRDRNFYECPISVLNCINVSNAKGQP